MIRSPVAKTATIVFAVWSATNIALGQHSTAFALAFLGFVWWVVWGLSDK